MTTKNKKDSLTILEKYEILSGIYIVIFSIIIIYIINNIFGFYDDYKNYLNNLYNHNYFINLIKSNIKYFLSVLIIYLIFLGYIKEKKGLVFGNIGESNINTKYGNIFILLNRAINFLLIFFIYYLYKSGNIKELTIISTFSFFIAFTLYILEKYIELRGNYKTLEKINEIAKSNKKNNNKNFDNFILKFFTGTYIDYLIGISFTLAFIIFPLGMKLNFNLITIFIIHFQFIFVYICLNLFSNKFPGIVQIKFDNQTKKGFLIEYTKDKIILITKNKNYILNPDKIEYIKTIK